MSKIIRRRPKASIPCEWYKIPEIPIKVFSNHLHKIYEVFEDKNKSESKEDIFARECWASYNNITTEQVDEERKRVQKDRVFTMKLGDFHQSLMGSFTGWENYDKGHETGCDIGKVDGSCVVEIKNNTNTMNSSSQESVLNKLNKQKELGKKSILVIVNGDIKQKEKNGIIWMSGKDFYAELSGRKEFFNDLLNTLKYVLDKYKTYRSLTEFVETL